MGEHGSMWCTVAEHLGEQAAAEGQTLARSRGAALFSVPGQKLPANLLKWEGGNWLVQLNTEIKKKKRRRRKKKESIHKGIFLGTLK